MVRHVFPDDIGRGEVVFRNGGCVGVFHGIRHIGASYKCRGKSCCDEQFKSGIHDLSNSSFHLAKEKRFCRLKKALCRKSVPQRED